MWPVLVGNGLKVKAGWSWPWDPRTQQNMLGTCFGCPILVTPIDRFLWVKDNVSWRVWHGTTLIGGHGEWCLFLKNTFHCHTPFYIFQHPLPLQLSTFIHMTSRAAKAVGVERFPSVRCCDLNGECVAIKGPICVNDWGFSSNWWLNGKVKPLGQGSLNYCPRPNPAPC